MEAIIPLYYSAQLCTAQVFSRLESVFRYGTDKELVAVLTETTIFFSQTDEEYENSYLSAVDATSLKRSLTLYSRNGNEAEEIDWRERGLVSNVSL